MMIYNHRHLQTSQTKVKAAVVCWRWTRPNIQPRSPTRQKSLLDQLFVSQLLDGNLKAAGSWCCMSNGSYVPFAAGRTLHGVFTYLQVGRARRGTKYRSPSRPPSVDPHEVASTTAIPDLSESRRLVLQRALGAGKRFDQVLYSSASSSSPSTAVHYSQLYKTYFLQEK